MEGCLEPIFQDLKGFRRIYLDLPGHGKTPASKKIKNADDMLDILKSFIEKVIGCERFLLIGESYGGYLSLGLIHLQQQVGGLFLIAPCVISDAQKRQLPSGHEMAVPLAETEEMRARYEREIQSGLSIADKEFTSRYRKGGYSFSFEDEIGNIEFHHPTGIVLGRQDDSVGYMDALALISNFTRATFMVADSAGHNLQIEKKELFTACLLDWVGSV